MNAKKCDRCGKYYELNRESKTPNAISKFKEDFCGFCNHTEKYDVCPKCMESFERWLSNENKNN